MADLIAQGGEAQQRWRRALPPEQAIVLGRAAGIWAVPWDTHVSRRHVSLQWADEGLEFASIFPLHDIRFGDRRRCLENLLPGLLKAIGLKPVNDGKEPMGFKGLSGNTDRDNQSKADRYGLNDLKGIHIKTSFGIHIKTSFLL